MSEIVLTRRSDCYRGLLTFSKLLSTISGEDATEEASLPVPSDSDTITDAQPPDPIIKVETEPPQTNDVQLPTEHNFATSEQIATITSDGL